MVSTDKACAPTNVYGMCKAIAERMVTSVASSLTKPKFVGVRYGNVLESRGSIIPLFRHQAETQDCFTVTHPEMTRFIMTLDQSIDLIEATAKGSKSGEIWLPKLQAMKIIDLAEVFARRYKKTEKIIGMRPGEKLHEDLVSEPESVRVIDEEGYYKLSPAFANVPIDAKSFHYASNHDLMTVEQLDGYLDSIGIFSKSMSDFVGRQIEEIVDVK
jgi:UDP-glucose 4-epimerase